ncbi:MAG: endonuclease [Bacilli bacterium]|nr:endonuclease [Bacilli bacterium]
MLALSFREFQLELEREERPVNKAQVKELLDELYKMYPDAECELTYSNPFELLIAVMLSAQCTDKLVNQVTPDLFAKFPDAASFASASLADIETAIRKIGLFRSKGKHIKEACRILVDQFGGQVPSSHEDLVNLPGVGRKTANVVRSVAFGIPTIAVDTHVDRLAHRLGLTKAQQVLQTELDLMKKIPKDDWIFTHHGLIFHGRRVCSARAPKCEQCPLTGLCSYYRTQQKQSVRKQRNKTSAGSATQNSV